MRASLSFCIVALTALSSPAVAEDGAAENRPDVHASCRIPFEKLKDSKTGEFFPLSAALNPSSNLADNLRQRYLVADLNSTDENGNCRGVQEHFSPVEDLSEFP